MSLRWPRGRIRELTGTLALDLAPGGDGRTPLGGRLVWRAREGTQFVDEATLRTPDTEARLHGRIEAGGAHDLAVTASSTDLARATSSASACAGRWASRTSSREGGAAAAGSRARGAGRSRRRSSRGRFSGQHVAFLGVTWGRAEWTGALEPERLRMEPLVVRRDGAELWLDGWMDTGLLGEQDALDVRVALAGWPAPDLTRALAWDVDLEGPVTGDATLQGRRSAPLGSARFRSPSGRFSGVPFDDLQVTAALRGPVTEVTTGAATVAGGRVEFHGTAADDGTYDGEATVRGVDVAALAARAGIATPWRGRVTGHAIGFGSLERPRLTATLEGTELAVAGESVGTLAAELQGQGDGALQVNATTSGRIALAVDGRIGMAAPYDAAFTVAMAQAPLDPFIRAFHATLPTTVGLSAAGRATVRGPLARPRELSAEAEVADVDLRLPDYPVSNRGPIVVAVRDGRIDLREFHLAGEGTDLEVTGTAGLAHDGPLHVSVEGAADLRAISLVSDELRGHGDTRLSVLVAGRVARRTSRGPWTWPETESGCAASRTGWRACGAGSRSTPTAPDGPVSPAPSAAARWSCPARPPTPAGGSPPSTSRARAAGCPCGIRKG